MMLQPFFSGCNIRDGPKNGIHFTYSSDGRPSGECFVELVSLEDMEKALSKRNNFIGKRYVEVFECKNGEMEFTCKRMGQPPDQGHETVLRLRGLPYNCSKEEIAHFFSGINTFLLQLLIFLMMLFILVVTLGCT